MPLPAPEESPVINEKLSCDELRDLCDRVYRANEELSSHLQAIQDAYEHEREHGVKWLNDLWMDEMRHKAPKIMKAIGGIEDVLDRARGEGRD
jgi:hypothetical protein